MFSINCHQLLNNRCNIEACHQPYIRLFQKSDAHPLKKDMGIP